MTYICVYIHLKETWSNLEGSPPPFLFSKSAGLISFQEGMERRSSIPVFRWSLSLMDTGPQAPLLGPGPQMLKASAPLPPAALESQAPGKGPPSPAGPTASAGSRWPQCREAAALLGQLPPGSTKATEPCTPYQARADSVRPTEGIPTVSDGRFRPGVRLGRQSRLISPLLGSPESSCQCSTLFSLGSFLL